MDILWMLLILEILTTLLTDISSSPIWRCPEFKLIPCKTPPKQCNSFRMIYIRHVHLECPACLICADALEPWTVQQTTSPVKHSKRRSKHHHKERRKRARRRRRRLLQQQMLGVSASNTTTKHRNKNQNRRKSQKSNKERKNGHGQMTISDKG